MMGSTFTGDRDLSASPQRGVPFLSFSGIQNTMSLNSLQMGQEIDPFFTIAGPSEP